MPGPKIHASEAVPAADGAGLTLGELRAALLDPRVAAMPDDAVLVARGRIGRGSVNGNTVVTLTIEVRA